MKKLLLKFLILLLFFNSVSAFLTPKTYAVGTTDTTTSTTQTSTTTTASDPGSGTTNTSANDTSPAQTPEPTGWQPDREVTFVGKTASRSGDFLDWTLQNYSWLCVTKLAPNKCDNTNDPLIPFWVIIRNIVYALIALFVLGTAFILIITRGQNITVMRFIPRFVFIILLITFSFSLIQFIYTVCDVVQDFFLKVGGVYITTKDLLFIGFDYVNFPGYRLMDPSGKYDESAFITLLLVRLTAITYYVMTGVLLIRKIILWFFIIISPIFPLLLFYKPIRNTAKIWIGEFFRWLLYAPLFTIFLHGLVIVWQRGIPLAFDWTGRDAGQIVYPTAVNILLGGPGQAISMSNSINLRDTFADYVIALLMLWVVILLPFLLLKIFLDYLNTISFGAGLNLRQVVSRANFLNNPKGIPPATPPPAPGLSAPTGAARSLPFFASRGATLEPIQVKADVQASVRESADVLRLANLSIPKMRDIAKYEASMMSKDSSVRNEATRLNSTLKNIANPNTAIVSSERQKFSTVRQKLIEQQQKGNPIASSIINASQISVSEATQRVENRADQISKALASSVLNVSNISNQTSVSREEKATNLSQTLKNIANPAAVTDSIERDKVAKVKEELMKQKEQGNSLAASILDASEKVGTSSAEGGDQMTSQLLDQLLNAEQTDNKFVVEIILKLHVGDLPFDESTREQQVKTVDLLLTNVSNPEVITTPSEREKFTSIQQTLITEEKKGNKLATSILEASKKFTSSAVDTSEKTKVRDQVLDSLLMEERKARPAIKPAFPVSNVASPLLKQALPTVNRVQQVSLDDYEQVRNLWTENYQTIDPPQDLSGRPLERREWIKNDIDKITEAIALLSSADPAKVNQGMNMVANILPFLLIGGFSKTEVIAYLKAKMEAGKSVITSVSKKEEEEESMLGTTPQKATAVGHMEAARELDNPIEKNPTLGEESGEKKVE